METQKAFSSLQSCFTGSSLIQLILLIKRFLYKIGKTGSFKLNNLVRLRFSLGKLECILANQIDWHEWHGIFGEYIYIMIDLIRGTNLYYSFAWNPMWSQEM